VRAAETFRVFKDRKGFSPSWLDVIRR